MLAGPGGRELRRVIYQTQLAAVLSGILKGGPQAGTSPAASAELPCQPGPRRLQLTSQASLRGFQREQCGS